jgi:UDP-4-amino-4,6-dideoxy-N-acetyl-beta-L-altrosamine N-acetyltransferase
MRFREVLPDDAEMILAWRTKPRVATQMATEVGVSLASHRAWLLGCYDRPDYYHWVIESEGVPVGLINLASLDFVARRSAWGFYIGEDHALGLGAFVPPYFYNFVIDTLGLSALTAEVLATNEAVLRLHMLHGYKRHPEKDQAVVKLGQPQTLLALSLAAEDWRKGRFTKMRAEFPIQLWRGSPFGSVGRPPAN